VGLPVSGLIAVAAGVVALVGTLVILNAATEDVTRHNGLSSTDPARLRWFIDHRPHALVTTARYISQIGSPVALALLVSVAAVVLWLVAATPPGFRPCAPSDVTDPSTSMTPCNAPWT